MQVSEQRAHARRGSVAAGICFVVWTVLVFRWPAIDRLDHDLLATPLTPGSLAQSLAIGISWLNHPIVAVAGMGGLALYARRRRLFRLAWALVLAAVLGWGGNVALKAVLRRPRPPRELVDPLIYFGSSYPSSHVATATTLAVMAVAVTRTVRARPSRVNLVRVAGVALIIIVAWNRWTLNAHWASDTIGGVLFGAFVGVFACVVLGVRLVPPSAKSADQAKEQPMTTRPHGICAVVFNPTKLTDVEGFKRSFRGELDARGWTDCQWLPTTEDDPGVEMAHAALDAGADLIVAMGGDGTVRVVCSELVGSEAPLAVLPAGTGNLLARNLGVPLDMQDAVEVALDGVPIEMDLVRVVRDDDESTVDHFAVMAGLGFDAQLMANTNEDLKGVVGPGAYVLAFAGELGTPPHEMSIAIDDEEPIRREAVLTVIGNVSSLQGGIQLLPDADPADGLLDVIVARPSGLSGWMRLFARILTKIRRKDGHLQEFQARRVRFELAEPTPYQFDGDAMGEAKTLSCEVVPRAIRVMAPATR